jgi:hypothetical protein
MPDGYEGVSNPPDGGNVSTVTPPPAENGAARDQWMNTAGGGSPKPAAPVGAGTQQAPTATPSPIQQPAPKPPTAPVVTSTKRGGLLGVMDSVTDALVGKTRPEVGTDADGNAYIKQHTMTRGQQWMRIAGEAMRGGAAGLAAGRGAGNMGKAAQAGIEAQQGASDKEKADVRQQVLDNANNQMLRMNMAEQAWRAKRLGVEANEHDIAFWQGQEDRLTKAGATELGTVAHPGDLTGALKVNPTMMEDLVKNHSLEFVPVQKDGVTQGFKVFKTSEGYRDSFVPAGKEFPTFNSVKGEYEWHQTTAPSTQGAIDDYWTGAGNAKLKFEGDKKEQELKEAQRKEAEQKATAGDKELQGKMDLTQAQIGEAKASAHEKTAQAGKLDFETQQLKNPTFGGSQTAGEQLAKIPPTLQNSLYGLADYTVNPESFPTRTTAKSGQMDRETAIGLAKQINPSYDETQYKNRNKTRMDFGSGKARATINSLNQAVDHLNRLSGSIQALNNSPFWVLNAGKNIYKASTDDPTLGNFKKDATAVANEMATVFKGSGATDQEIKAWKESISAASGPKTLNDGVDEMLQLMAGRLNAINDQWTSTMGDTRDFHILSPHARDILSKLPGGNDLVQADTSNSRQSYREVVPPTVQQQAPPRPPGVPPGAAWNQQANKGKGAWIL